MGNALAELDGLCLTFGSGPLPSGNTLHKTGSMPQWLRRKSMTGKIWKGTTSQERYFIDGSLSHWQGDRPGLQQKKQKNIEI
jgi:hypothetical protein